MGEPLRGREEQEKGEGGEDGCVPPHFLTLHGASDVMVRRERGCLTHFHFWNLAGLNFSHHVLIMGC
jgi:hypothetical protein